MISQRIGVTALRRGPLAMTRSVGAAVAGKPNLLAPTHDIARLAAMTRLPAAHVQTRPVTTAKLTASTQESLLAQQRLKRPVSPNLGIYDPLQTWFGHSAWTRITGSTLSGGLYAFALAYLAAPLLGLHLESASVAASVAALPLALKGALKFVFAWPFAYHAINGVRHLVYDFGLGYARKHITMINVGVWSSSVVAGVYMAFLM